MLTACSPSLRIAGNLPADQLKQITEVVAATLETEHADAKSPITSIEVRTNDAVPGWVGGKLAIKTNDTVWVWYADSGARWGEAGYILQHSSSNRWEITGKLTR